MLRASLSRLARWAVATTVLLLTSATVAQAQSATGSIAGTVTDPNGRPLVGVQVVVDDGSLVVSTDRDGRYRVTRVQAGQRTLTFRYIGFERVERTVSVTAGATASLDAQLTEAAAVLSAVQVRGQVAGQASALNQQRTATNISSVIDNELVGRLPDPNLAEALARVPGVAMVRDQGEGRFVQIRGTAPNLNSMSINGLRVATPEQNSRQLPMDIIPSEQAGAIQVSKTLTPDMDADAIGGNVNLVTRNARKGQTLLNFTTAGGQNQLGGGTLLNVGANAGKRFGADEKLGIMLGGTYYLNERASQNFEGTWCVQEANCGAVGNPARSSLNAPALFELRDYPQVNRLRQGVNSTVDYQVNDNHKLFLRGTYNFFSDDEIRYRTRFGFAVNANSQWNMVSADSGVTTGSRMDRDIRLRKVDQTITTAQFGGEHIVQGGTAIDWTVGTSRATEDRPDVIAMAFRQTGMSFGYNFADPDRPRVSVAAGSFDDPTRFPLNSLQRLTRETRDTDLSGRFNVSVPVDFGEASGFVKFGGAARLKDRSNIDRSRNFTSAIGQNTAGVTGATLLNYLTTSTDPRQLFDGDYTMGRTMDPARVRSFVLDNQGAFTLNQASSTINTAGSQFTVGEDVYAGYIMASLDIGRLNVVPGVRIEATQVENTANRVQVQGSNVTVTPTTGSSSYANVLPSVNATFRVDDATNVRGAVTTSLVRPQFRSMAPFVSITIGQPTVAIGNPDLDATTAINYDFMVERYFKSVGFISAGVFAKSLKNFIFTTSRPVAADENFGPDATLVIQEQNGPTATLTGFEIAWQQNLTFLPGLLSGLGLNANYTYTRSETSLDGRDGVKTSLPEQTGNAGNVGVFYDKGPASLRLGMNYSGEFLSTINPETPLGDTRTRARLQVDLAGSYRVRDNVKLFAEVINLTNTPLRAFVGNELNRGGGGDDPSFEFYKRWGMMGVRIER